MGELPLNSIARTVLLLMFMLAVGPLALANEESPEVRKGPRSHFRAQSQGSPVASLVGHWDLDHDSAELLFAGGNTVTAWTRFRAVWVSPFTKKSRQPSLSSIYRVVAGNELGRIIKLRERWRFRLKGHRWSRWKTYAFDIPPGEQVLAAWPEKLLQLRSKHRVQFKWVLAAVLRGPTSLDGWISLSVR